MNNARNKLKNAFIDLQLLDYSVSTHSFSKEFEFEMQKIIKYQKGFLKLINTTGRKIACVLLSIIVVATSVVFSVEALRTPVVNAVESFFVNAKELLTGSNADNIAVNFSDDITEIVATNMITSKPKSYVIDDKEKISEFINLLTETGWGTPENESEADTEYVTYKFELKSQGKTVTTINLCVQFAGLFGVAEIIHNGQSSVYNISERTYLDILAFTTQKYYLHKSGLQQPAKEQCVLWQKEALAGLNENDRKEFCESFKWLHIHIENFLLGHISTLKEPDSIYWDIYELEKDEVYTDPITGTKSIDNTYHIMLENLEKLIVLAENKEIIDVLKTIKADYISAFNHHDIGSLFSIHEVIHDYDYYVVNYPISYSLEPPERYR